MNDVGENLPFYVKDYGEYYKGRAYHEGSLNSNKGWNALGRQSFMNQPILKKMVSADKRKEGINW